ncbi:hypothetical protein FBY40_0103 [Microbacterium sp. SLBN-154]|nr:hypothetical protein FBY40_0103 [Microbacterium sp. SLBN-154]
MVARTIPPLQIWHAMHLAVLNSQAADDSPADEGANVDAG